MAHQFRQTLLLLKRPIKPVGSPSCCSGIDLRYAPKDMQDSRKYILSLFLWLSSCSVIFSQEIDKQPIEQLIEEICGASEDAPDPSVLYDDLYYFSENPINLNTATREELEKLEFLNDFHIEDILEYQRTIGSMRSIYELQLLPSFSKQDIRYILPFVEVKNKENPQNIDIKKALKYGRNSLFLRTQFLLQQAQGYKPETKEENRYKGNPLKYYTRYQFNYKRKILFGFVAEKDPGEEFFKGSQKQGFDYYSGHLQINNIGKCRTITAGDFQVRFGQGLTVWTGMGLRKSSYVLAVKKKADGLRKYSSSDENRFMRGIGASFRLGKFDLSGFFSYKKIDGNIKEPDDDLPFEALFVSSLQSTGLHRNEGELKNRKSVSEMIWGGNIKWRHPKIKIGASIIDYSYDKPLQKTPNHYNSFEFSGTHGLNTSLDYQTQIKHIHLFGEGAMSLNGGFAILNSAVLKPAPKFSLVLLQRYYSRDYQAPYASAFGEQSRVANENGIYFGTEIHPLRQLTLSAYFDTYKFLWLRFRNNSLSNGYDFFIQSTYNLNRYVNMHLRYKQENGFENSAAEIPQPGIRPVVDKVKREMRYHLSCQLSKNLELKSRVALAFLKKEDSSTEKGFLLYQDINYLFSRIPLKFNFRLGYFDATYNTRIYAYEDDILYGYSIPGYMGSGIRSYLTLKYTIIKDFIDVWLRFANTSYSDRENIGSSHNAIQGCNKSEVKFQIRIKF